MPGETAERNTAARRQQMFLLSQAQIQRFLTHLEEDGWTKGTVQKYRADISRFHQFLPKDKRVARDALARWREHLLQDGYSARTINSSVSSVNSLLDYLGRRDWQSREWVEVRESAGPELTREEYLRLLEEAKRQEDIQIYLLVKTLVCTGLFREGLPALTREAVNSGAVAVNKRRNCRDRQLTLPAQLRDELLDYAMRKRIRSGPVFRMEDGSPMRASTAGDRITALGKAAGLEPGRANARNLKRLYQRTCAAFQREADRWVEESYTRLLASEEERIGWRVWPQAARSRATDAAEA